MLPSSVAPSTPFAKFCVASSTTSCAASFTCPSFSFHLRTSAGVGTRVLGVGSFKCHLRESFGGRMRVFGVGSAAGNLRWRVPRRTRRGIERLWAPSLVRHAALPGLVLQGLAYGACPLTPGPVVPQQQLQPRLKPTTQASCIWRTICHVPLVHKALAHLPCPSKFPALMPTLECHGRCDAVGADLLLVLEVCHAVPATGATRGPPAVA